LLHVAAEDAKSMLYLVGLKWIQFLHLIIYDYIYKFL
jgi:hypothetical protein